MIPQSNFSALAPTPPILNTPGGPSQPLQYARSPGPGSSSGHPSPGSPRHQSGTLDVESVLRSHGGDLRRTLDAIVSDRNHMQQQNTQLWRLIEKQRAQCAHLAADNDRLRQDRERANQRLVAAGLEPIPIGNRRGLPQSQSALTISSQESRRPEDEKQTSAATITPVAMRAAESSSSLAPSAMPHSDNSSQSSLLPSPMPERRLRHESRMTFPPEVASFMALAEGQGQREPQLASTLSPLSPLPSISDHSISQSSHTSSPGESQFASPIEEQSEELTSVPPRPSQDTVISRPSHSPVVLEPRPSTDSTATAPRLQTSPPPGDHTFLTPALLPHARLSIPSATVFPNQNGRDVLGFIVQVNIKPPTSRRLSWSVAKTFSTFMELDQRTQERSSKSKKDWKRMVTPLPEGKAWKDFAPGKIDQRKAALESYLESLLVAPVSDKSDLVSFLTSDVVNVLNNSNRKEGYLTRKSKNNFGGMSWKTRYFVLDGAVMKFFESRGGQLLGSILLTGAQVAKQSRSDYDARHAFLIVEAARGREPAKQHVLCASSDIERDQWIEVLMRQIEPETLTTPTQSRSDAGMEHGHQRRRSAIRKSSKDVVVTSAQPMSALPDANAKFFSGAPLPSVINQMETQRQLQNNGQPVHPAHHVKDPTNGGPSPPPQGPPLTLVTSAATFTSNDLLSPFEPSATTPKVMKRQSAMPPIRQSFSPAYLTKLAVEGTGGPGFNVDRERDRKAKSGRFWGFGKPAEKVTRPVFGVPLPESLAIACVAGLPAIVFRCIEYLEAKGAEQEEGIYRLSGSSAVIKGLKERFNQEGDVNLLQLDERWDPHAIAGLLKTYLRELPTSLLTRELHLRFLAVIDLVDPAARVAELSRLVSDLPPANYALLRAFTAHLILIVRNSAVNKMTLRNIGIVFSPTLGIPAGIFYELVSRFGAIFDDDAEEVPLDEPAQASPSGEEQVSKRNSVLYHAGGADALLGLSGRALDPATEDSTSELSMDDLSEAVSTQSSDNLSLSTPPPRRESEANGSSS